MRFILVYLSMPSLFLLACGLYYRSFTIVIYDRNDSSQYYNTMITIVR